MKTGELYTYALTNPNAKYKSLTEGIITIRFSKYQMEY